MKTNYRDMLGMPKLVDALRIERTADLNAKQMKAVKNIKYCANDMWQYVNCWYDEKSENARQLIMNPKAIFKSIYHDSLENIYNEGMCCFNQCAKQYLKDIHFCGKAFLMTVVFYYTAKLLEESVIEVEGTNEDAQRVLNELVALKKEVIE